MSWIHVKSTELNQHDYFAFVNLKDSLVVKGRLFTSSAGIKSICAMNDEGEVYDLIELPKWCTEEPEDSIIRTIFEEIARLPGGDVYNKVHNINNGNYSAEQLFNLADAVVKKAIEKPALVILKYVPDLSLTMEDMNNFIFEK